MPDARETIWNEALSAVHAGDRSRARDLLSRLIREDKNNPDYWVWMSAVVDTPKEGIYCLKTALSLDPQNAAARRGLSILGAMPPDAQLAVPAALQRRSWQVKLPSDLAEERLPGPPKWQLALMGVALLAVVAVFFFVFSSISERRKKTTLYVDLPTSTPGAVAQVTPTATSRSPLSGSPTPLWMLLDATYTPTPLAVKTPHPSEAYGIAMRAFQAGDWSKAETYLIQVATSEPGSVDILFYLGEAALRAGDYPEALKWYNQAIELNASFAPAYVGRARVRMASDPKALEDALADLTAAAGFDPQYGEIFLATAELRLQAGQPQEALDALAQAADLLPASPMLYLYRAQANLALGSTDQALADALKANQLDITLLPAYRMIGEVRLAQGDAASALEALNTYTRYAPNDPDAWVWVARAYLNTQKLDDALKALDRALRLDANLVDARLVRAGVLLEKKRPADALKDYEFVLRVNKESFEALMGSAQALIALDYPGDAYKSIESAKSLVETDAQQAAWTFWRARSLDDLKSYDEVALGDYRKLLEMPKDSVKPEWLAYARQRIAALVTSTPTQKARTATPTKKASPSSTPIQKTVTPTPTVKATRAPTATPKK